MHSVRLAEWAGNIVGLMLFRSFAGVAVCGLVARVAGTCLSIWLAQRGGHGLLWGTKLAQKREIMTMIRPAVSFLAFPLANACPQSAADVNESTCRIGGMVALAAGGLAVLLAWLFGQAWQVEGVAAAMLVSESFIALVCGYLVHRLLFTVPGVKSSLT
jgi:hypothetical protein